MCLRRGCVLLGAYMSFIFKRRKNCWKLKWRHLFGCGGFWEEEGEANYTSLSSEPIQSRCAVLRYTKLTDAQILARLLKIVEKEDVPYTDDGLEAIIFTAQGDMRQVKGERQWNKGFCLKQKPFELQLSRISFWRGKAKEIWLVAQE